MLAHLVARRKRERVSADMAVTVRYLNNFGVNFVQYLPLTGPKYLGRGLSSHCITNYRNHIKYEVGR